MRSPELISETLTARADVEELSLPIERFGAAGLELDRAFAPVVLPAPIAAARAERLYATAHAAEFSTAAEEVSVVIRGSIPDGDEQQSAVAELLAQPEVIGVFSDPTIETFPICADDPPVGTTSDVAARLHCDELQARGMAGSGVPVAIVDTGFNDPYLQARGRRHAVDTQNSFTPTGVSTSPGQHPVEHGTMCAYDVGIAAPEAVLLDHAVLLSAAPGRTVMEGLLSDAVRAYAQLRAFVVDSSSGPGSLVVSNSWGMYDPAWDFPATHPGNYSDSSGHPFNLIVASLEAVGADVLFAAGNCGRDCPVDRCRFPERPICGANSHPAVLSVAGIDVHNARLGYSSQGPGRLSNDKPDLCGYSHFEGSGVYAADSGTSASCPVVAGVVAAVRTRYPASSLAPGQLRALLFRTAIDLGGHGYDHDYGWGGVDPAALLEALPDPS
jgi:subtilisin family serine protease